VPYTRGPEYSRSFYKIIDEAKQLIKNGTKEITLLGQNVNAYLYKEENKIFKLSDLIMKLEEFSELKRIRYTTSHPIDMTDDLIECYKKSKKLVPFVHLPVQSGSNKILKLMNRKHTIEKYLLICKKLKKINPKIELSSDFIIAYPGETDEDFNNTIKLIKKIKFINSYSFIFSPRPGTAASNLKLINQKVAQERLNLIQTELFSHQNYKNKMTKNKIVNVLVENKIKNQNKFFGRTEYMTAVIFDGEENIEGKIVPVLITHYNQSNLFGEIKLNKNIKAA
jgi:tRNA-2-methylthio-N6-dimethylallyladenosine synthase